jgi:hypothetical protein
MPFLLPILARIGIPERFRQAVGILAALLAVVLIVGLIALAFSRWIAAERVEAVQIDRADMTIEAANRVIAADRVATANQIPADEAFQSAQKEVQRDVDTKSDGSAVGPGTAAVLRRVREQQAAGRR